MPHDKKSTLSLCLIVRDEEANIERCLTSVRSVVEQIVLVDTGSTDNTLKIAAMSNAELYEFDWNNDFSAARNFAMKKATGDWILHLDADEALSVESIDVIKSAILNKDIDAYLIRVRNFHPKSDQVKYSDSPQVRLFRNSPQTQYTGKIHEQVTIGNNKDSIIPELDATIYHYGYRENNQIKASRNLNYILDALQSDPKNAYLNFKLAETLKALKRNQEAREQFALVIDQHMDELTKELQDTVFMRMAQLELEFNRFEQAHLFAKRGLSINPENIVTLFLLSIALLYLSRIDQAEKILLQLNNTADRSVLDGEDVNKLIAVCNHLKSKGLASE